MTTRYDQEVGARYHIYNSLFLNLPFQHILRTGTLLPLLQHYVETGFEKGESATEIITSFFKEMVPEASRQEQFQLLFNFVQYVERQVALFDSIEDSAFEQINDINGKGTVTALLLRSKFENKDAELRQRLDDFSLRVVLTAHPTQFYPGHVLGILTDLERAIREKRAAAYVTNDLNDADAVMAIRSTVQAKPRRLRDLAGRPVNTVVVKRPRGLKRSNRRWTRRPRPSRRSYRRVSHLI